MREKLIQSRVNHELAIERINKALKLLEERPELETMMDAWQSMINVPLVSGF
jgi:hypothetical protein